VEGLVLGGSLFPLIGRELGTALFNVGFIEGSISGDCGDGSADGVDDGSIVTCTALGWSLPLFVGCELGKALGDSEGSMSGACGEGSTDGIDEGSTNVGRKLG
jgi:hypothetical protein